MKIVPVIITGGMGTRLWPLSTEDSPKQFQSFIGDETLLQQTIKRVLSLNFEHPPILITQERHRFLVKEQIKDYCDDSKIILEPKGRDTGPAFSVASHYVNINFPDSIVAIFPCDHLITDLKQFKESIYKGIKSAQKDTIVTFGVKPTKLHTGYGYIQKGSKNENGSHQVKSFHEKPNEEKAKQYLKEDSFFWNSGIYMFKPKILLKELSQKYSSIIKNSINSLNKYKEDGNFIRLDEEEFLKNQEISIDFAVMENTKAAVLVELSANWSDLGSWDAIFDVSEKDKHNNYLEGNIYVKETEGSLIKTKKRSLVAIGLKDILIVETEDDLFISPISKTSSLKSVLKENILNSERVDITRRKIVRPWGSYQIINQGEQFLVKKIIVNKNSKLSLQTHKYRAENWVVVEGRAKVTLEKEKIILEKDSSIYIPQGAKHRLENIGSGELVVIEVQSGQHLSESDIERFEDDYNR